MEIAGNMTSMKIIFIIYECNKYLICNFEYLIMMYILIYTYIYATLLVTHI